MKNSKNILLLAILLALIAATYWLSRNDGQKTGGFQAPTNLFSIPLDSDPNKVILENASSSSVLEERAGQWYFNKNTRMKPELVDALLLILKRLEIKRPLSKTEEEELFPKIDSLGRTVKVYEGENLLRTFMIWGNHEEKISYAKIPDAEGAYIVEIPGYSTYIAGIFFYEENKWRNDHLFESTWRSLKALTLKKPANGAEGFSILYNENFFHIPQITDLDTAALLDYLEDFSRIEVEKYLAEGKINRDSLLKIAPALIVSIDDVDSSRTNSYHFYRRDPNSDQIIVIGKDQRVGIISESNFNLINRADTDFVKD